MDQSSSSRIIGTNNKHVFMKMDAISEVRKIEEAIEHLRTSQSLSAINRNRLPSTRYPAGERAGWQIRADNGDCPREIQQRILRRTEAEIEEQHRQYRVVEPRIEEHAEKDKAPPVAIGGVAGIGNTHASWAILSAFAPVAIAYRSSLIAVTVVVLAAVVLFAGVAYSQEP